MNIGFCIPVAFANPNCSNPIPSLILLCVLFIRIRVLSFVILFIKLNIWWSFYSFAPAVLGSGIKKRSTFDLVYYRCRIFYLICLYFFHCQNHLILSASPLQIYLDLLLCSYSIQYVWFFNLFYNVGFQLSPWKSSPWYSFRKLFFSLYY